MLTVFTFLGILSVPELFKGSQLPGFEYPSWWNLYNSITGFITLISIAGIWLWKKWAAIIFIMITCVGIVLSQIFVSATLLESGSSGSNITLISYLIGAALVVVIDGLFIWAIVRKYNFFD